jgi:hypothetical protein
MNRAAQITGISSTILLLTLLFTNPERLPSIFLMLPFGLLFIVLVSAIYYALGFLGIRPRARLRIGMAAAAVPVLLLVLQSLGQLTPRDTLVVCALGALAYFYSSKLGIKPIV